MMTRSLQILFLLLINIGLIFVSLQLLDMLQIIDYKQIFASAPIIRDIYSVRLENEDPYLLERLELSKKKEILALKTNIYNEEKTKLESELSNLNVERARLEAEKEKVRNTIGDYDKLKAEQLTYDKRVEIVAIQIENMPPDASVRILALQDDMIVIDVFKKMNQRALEEGKQSLVPFLLSKLEPEQAARVQRKMLE